MKYYVTKFHISDTNSDGDDHSERLQAARDILAALVAQVGYESFEETETGLNGYVPADIFHQEALDECLKTFPMDSLQITCETEEMEETNWNATWEQEGFEPIYIGDQCVIHNLSRPVEKEYPYDIVIDAKQSFGTGTHETTRLMVSALLDLDLDGKRVLDCGCGTGILSIVASKCGAQEVVSYDIDEWCTRNTEHNAQLNDVNNLEVLLGNAHVLSHVSGVFDVVLANINRNILLADMPRFKEVMTHGSLLIISGFYEKDSMILAEKAGELGMSLLSANSENDWCILQFRID